jgi:capsular exopolysaccharide synthesis family protein
MLGIVAVTGSALIAAAIAIGRDLLAGRQFRTMDDVESEIGFPALAMLPKIRVPRRGGAIALDPRSPMASALGVLRNSIYFSCPGGKSIVVVLASAIAGDGKTVVSALLAKNLDAGGKRVLLIDADLHRRGLSRLLHRPAEAGLTDVLRGKKALGDCVVRETGSGIDILTAGDASADAVSLLAHDRVAALLEDARRSYDVVVVDTPPIAAVDDAMVFSSVADATVLVIRWASTPCGVVAGAVRRLRLSGANLVGAVLNATVASKYHQSDLESLRLSGRYFLQKS